MKTITRKGQQYHRTRLLSESLAERFAICLEANPRFTSITVEAHPTATGAKRHFVQYQPASDESYRRMVETEQAARERRAIEEADNYLFCLDDTRRFFHCLNFTSGQVYEVTQHTCNCPDSVHRGAAVGACKHRRLLTSGRAIIRTWAQEAAPQATPESTGDRAAQAAREKAALWP